MGGQAGAGSQQGQGINRPQELPRAAASGWRHRSTTAAGGSGERAGLHAPQSSLQQLLAGCKPRRVRPGSWSGTGQGAGMQRGPTLALRHAPLPRVPRHRRRYLGSLLDNQPRLRGGGAAKRGACMTCHAGLPAAPLARLGQGEQRVQPRKRRGRERRPRSWRGRRATGRGPAAHCGVAHAGWRALCRRGGPPC